MDPQAVQELGRIGAIAAVSLSAAGSGLGTSIAGQAAVGVWKKAYAQGRTAPFTLFTFVGAPLSQTIYGMILMFTIAGKADAGYNPFALLGVGFFAGLAIGVSAWMQGVAGAAAADSLGETGEGFTNYLSVIGIVETVAIFVMVFVIIAL
ncbi:MAG: V-type ATP synthase subunit K [Actinobacteria bacterium ADurb.Bin444]|nr:V-type ATP synthase subunit K [Actinomycetota bacterium]OPZ79820.1 MAG: V-type ATP synthase subunit K [Actinobacteria bacterium ADurb.Bin444]